MGYVSNPHDEGKVDHVILLDNVVPVQVFVTVKLGWPVWQEDMGVGVAVIFTGFTVIVAPVWVKLRDCCSGYDHTSIPAGSTLNVVVKLEPVPNAARGIEASSKSPVGGKSRSAVAKARTSEILPVLFAVAMLVFSTTVPRLVPAVISPASLTLVGSNVRLTLTNPILFIPAFSISFIVWLGGRVKVLGVMWKLTPPAEGLTDTVELVPVIATAALPG